MLNTLLNRKPFASAMTIALLFAGAVGYGWQSQDAIVQQSAPEDKQFQTAANKWMKAPVDVRNQTDPVPTEQRQVRDAHWDNLIGASAPLSDSAAHARLMPHPDAVLSQPEFGDLGDGVMIIGKFESYRAVLSGSQRSVYTEIQMRVQHVFGHPNAPIREGDLIDVLRPGGTIIAPWGATISYGLHPEQMGLQPGHTYLIRLGYHANGNFYTGGGKTGEMWDVTDGTVKPGNSMQKARAEHGVSEINGLSVDAVTRLLDKKYEEYYARGR